MGLFSRLSTVFKSNINDLIARAENPEKMLNQIILDMRDQLAKAKREVAAAIADERKLRSQLDEEVKHRQGRLTKPDRIYFDLLETRLSQDLAARTFPIGDGFLKQIRAGQNKPDVVRVVLDLFTVSFLLRYSRSTRIVRWSCSSVSSRTRSGMGGASGRRSNRTSVPWSRPRRSR